jgi:DNA-binding MarR family transcriptional regulator
MMEIEKASVGRIVDRLERNGWVSRQADPGDRRINRLYLTAEAEKVHKRMWRVAEATIDDALADLDEAEAEQLQILMGRVKSRLTVLAAGDTSDPATQGRRGSNKSNRDFNSTADADEAIAS